MAPATNAEQRGLDDQHRAMLRGRKGLTVVPQVDVLLDGLPVAGVLADEMLEHLLLAVALVVGRAGLQSGQQMNWSIAFI